MKKIAYSITILGIVNVEEWQDEEEISSLIKEDIEKRGIPFEEINDIDFDEMVNI